MKKVLSAIMAAAMVMGMSVSAFAVTFETSTTVVNTSSSTEYVSFGKNNDGYCEHPDKVQAHVDNVYFKDVFYVNGIIEDKYHFFSKGNLDDVTLNPGDVLYFVPTQAGGNINYGKKVVDEHWSINIKANEYVKDASFTWASNYDLLVKVELATDLDEIDVQEIALELYIADNYDGFKAQSEGVKLVLPFDNYKEEYVSFELYIADEEFKNEYTESVIVNALGFANVEAGVEQVSFKKTNDADKYNQWEAKENGEATFDFDSDAYFTVKMVKNEAVVLNLSRAYNKDIDKAYNDNDGDMEFYNFKGTKDEFTKVGELFIPAKADTFIYEVVDGELVEVDAEWYDSYKVDGFKAKKGWVIDTNELGYYVVADEELVVAEVETEVEAPVEAEKANPETGAADFVGAAVAMAVVSVAAAGALALKK